MPGKLVWEAETAQISFQASMEGPELAGQTKTPPYQKVSTVGRHLLTAVAQRSHRINLPGGKCAKSLMMWFPSGNRGHFWQESKVGHAMATCAPETRRSLTPVCAGGCVAMSGIMTVWTVQAISSVIPEGLMRAQTYYQKYLHE